MLKFHPEYDTAAAAWFVPGLEFEAASLRELQRLVGPAVTLVGYYPQTLAAACAERFVANARRLRALALAGPAPPQERARPAPRETTVQQVLAAARCRQGGKGKKRQRCRAEIERVLDLWAGGATAASIAREVGSDVPAVSYVVRLARGARDPRAVRRAPGWSRHADPRAREKHLGEPPSSAPQPRGHGDHS